MKADRGLEQKKLEIDVYNAETLRIRALSDNEVDGNKMEQDAIQAIIDASTKVDEHDIRRDEIEGRLELEDKKLSAKPTPKSAQASDKSRNSAAG